MKLRRVAAGAISVVLAITMVSTSAFAADPSFKDVPSNHWAKQSITAMADKGIMTGVADGVFAPSNTLTYVKSYDDDGRELLSLLTGLRRREGYHHGSDCLLPYA